ncbi:NADPH-dependent FMN reductase [Kitasatospora sp. NPDC048365]|uniref:NADPH-dependent FMN reductase n=1 Tax=Kitasatospora sp. NPDC048365 TaxID=3364050 RepID=UPI003719B589
MEQDRPRPSSTPENLRVLVISGSAREGSLNARLAALAADAVRERGSTADLTDVRELDVPGYDGDREHRDGLPAGALRLKERLETTDALVIASPEYNASMPGVLKNLIDWTSRIRPQPFHNRHTLLLSASPSMSGGNRGLWALRVPLEHLGAHVYPDMFSLAQAHQAFTAGGRLADGTLAARFTDNLVNFLNLVEAAKHYPCVKKAWVEYLGERPDPAFDRTEETVEA